MPEFAYTGTAKTGKRVKAKINASSETEAKTRLRLMGVRVSSISSGTTQKVASDNQVEAFLQKISLTLNRKKNVKAADLVVFTKQMSTLVDAGISIVQALDMLSKQISEPSFRVIIEHVREQVEGGKDFATALEKHPEAFDTTYVALVRAGAQSGQLDTMLKKLTVYIEKGHKLKRQLVSALSYPTVVMALAFFLTLAMLLFVVPMFAKNYEESGKPLPALTQFVISGSNWLKGNWYFLFAAGFAAVTIFKQWKKTPNGHLAWDTFMLKLPVFGALIAKISVARFTGTMSTLISSGIGLPDSLKICAKASGNLMVEKEVMGVESFVVKGKSLSESMAKCAIFPIMVTGMVSIGEGTGRLDSMMEKIANIYEEDVEVALNAALKMVEPAMFVIVGAIVGFILLAMYLPIFDLASTVM